MASKVVGVGVVSTGEPPVQGVIRNLNSRQASPSFTASSRRHAANPVRQTTCRPSPLLPHFGLIINDMLDTQLRITKQFSCWFMTKSMEFVRSIKH
jgi:hypothetical protein